MADRQGPKEVDYYGVAIRLYAEDPTETRTKARLLPSIIVVLLLLAFAAGVAGGLTVRSHQIGPVACWELIALFCTAVLAFFYFLDLWRVNDPAKDLVIRSRAPLALGPIWVVTMLVLLLAGVLIVWNEVSDATAHTPDG